MSGILGSETSRYVGLSRHYYARRWLIFGAAIFVILVPALLGYAISGRLERFRELGQKVPAKVASYREKLVEIEYMVGRRRFQKTLEVSDAESKSLLARPAPTVLVLDGEPDNAFFGEIDQEMIDAPWRKACLAIGLGLFVVSVAYGLLAWRARSQKRALQGWISTRARVMRVDYRAAVWPRVPAFAFSNSAAVTLRYAIQNVPYEVTIKTKKDLTPGRGAAIHVNPESRKEIVLSADCELVELVPAWKVHAGREAKSE